MLKTDGQFLQRTGRRRLGRIAVLAILLAAAGVRLAYWSERRQEPDFAAPGGDALYHFYWAEALATGRWAPPAGYADPELRSHAYFRPPGYSYVLGTLFAITGASPLAAWWLQFVVGLAGVGVGYRLAKRWWGEAAGLCMGLFLGVLAPFVYYEAEWMEPTLLVLLGLLLLTQASRWMLAPRAWGAACIGLWAGAYALVRPNLLVFVPFLAAWMWRQHAPDAPPRVRVCRAILPLLLGLGAAIAPATIRNRMAGGEWVLISSNAGINLYLGNNEQADGLVAFHVPGLGFFGSSFDYPDLVRSLERREGRRFSHAEASAWFAARARAFMAEHPGRALHLAARKLLLFLSPEELGHTKEDGWAMQQSRVLRWLPGSFAALAALCALSVAARGCREGGAGGARNPAAEFHLLLLLFVAAFLLSYVPFIVTSRYRVPLSPVLGLCGVAGVARIVRATEGRPGRRAAWAVAALLLWEGFARLPAGAAANPAKWHYDRAIAFRALGDETGSARELELARRQDPRFLAELYRSVAMARADEGRLEDAIVYARLAAGERPGRDTHLLVARLAVALSAPGEAVAAYRAAAGFAPEDPEVLLEFATLLTDLNESVEALLLLRTAEALAPTHADIPFQRALALHRAGRAEEALEAMNRVLELDPNRVAALTSLAALQTAAGQFDQAMALLQRAKAIDPRNAEVLYSIGFIHFRREQYAEAQPWFEAALELRPHDMRIQEAIVSVRERLKAPAAGDGP